MDAEIILDYLKKLSENNNRPWFIENRNSFNIAKNSFELLTGALIGGISAFDRDIKFLEPKDCTFRIYRDVRFSSDKSPYKTNFGTFLAKGGKNGGKAGYYLHLEPGNCFVSGGIYLPDTVSHKAIRSEIYSNPAEFNKILRQSKLEKEFSNLSDEDKLSKGPKGYPKDFEFIDLLKYRSYVFLKPYSDKDVTKENFPVKAIKNFELLHPFVQYLNTAIENYDYN